jgi:hypothetical protein
VKNIYRRHQMKLSKAIIKKYGISKKAWAVARGERSTGQRRNTNMAKKHSRKSSGSFGGGKLMNGMFKPSGIVAAIVLGAGAAVIANKYVPIQHPLKGAVAGFVVGGLPGAAAGYFISQAQGSTSSGSDLVTGY